MMSTPEKNCARFGAALAGCGLYSPDGAGNKLWRISPEPYWLSAQEWQFFSELGPRLLAFYQALNRLYAASLKGKIPSWFAAYLDLGKPSDLVDYGRMNRFKQRLPGIIRPDVIVAENGFVITELDSVPGGFGLLAALMSVYAEVYPGIAGAGNGGVPALFYRMLESAAGGGPCSAAIVVADESADYMDEMRYLAGLLRARGLPVAAARPCDLHFTEDGIFRRDADGETRLDVIYRFFELFDLKNIPKSELLLYANKKEKVCVTPPYKAFLEEKLSFALLHHPVLAPAWEKELGGETFAFIRHLIPKTWILDPGPLPPHAVIPGLEIRGAGVREWQELLPLTQKERELVIKPSGFSPLAWGGRGVVVGHDVSSEVWRQAVTGGLAAFAQTPSIVQEFHKGRRVNMSYYDQGLQTLQTMESRARLTPYYFVIGGEAHLGGIKATLCRKDKKKIHGMSDAIIAPCAVKN